MSRWYDVTFRESGTGREVTIRQSGNTRRSAERYARTLGLRYSGFDPKRCFVVDVLSVPKGAR